MSNHALVQDMDCRTQWQVNQIGMICSYAKLIIQRAEMSAIGAPDEALAHFTKGMRLLEMATEEICNGIKAEFPHETA